MKLALRLAILIISLNLTSSSGVFAAPTSKSDLPATVDKPGDEFILNRIKLSAKAKQRLGIRLAPVKSSDIIRYRMYSGEMLLPAIEGGKAHNEQSVMGLMALMTPSERVRVAESQIDADGRVAAAKVRLNAAGIVVKRAKKLVADKAGSQKALDQAQADYELAAADLKTLRNRRKLLGPPALATQTRDRLWVRVSVFVNDMDDLDLSNPARLGRLGSRSTEQDLIPLPSAPMFARNDAPTVDLFYSVNNRFAEYRLNQRVGVSIPIKGKSNGLVVPRPAILHDIHGNAWVYTQIDDLTYARQRVEIDFSKGDWTVLNKGLSEGTLVVTDGVPELFGTEFGIGK